MVQEPGGCFEQTSSSNYPNVMVLDYLKTQNRPDPELVGRVSGMLERGYRKLAGFETHQKGYEWFGQAPAHEALTAYGVLEFADMKRVWGGVDGQMLGRTVAYLRAQRDGAGGFVRNARALDSFGRAKPEITDAYIVYALTEAGVTDLGPEIERQRRLAASTDDPYLLALATSALLNLPAHRSDGQRAARRLAGLQARDGHFSGKDHSITRSTGQNLEVETTALATLALIKADGAQAAVRAGIEWLVRSRGGAGTWGATQATVLALKALTAYAMATKQMTGSGSIELVVNGRTVGRQSYQAGRSEALVLDGFGKMLTAGANKVQIVHQGERALPYSLAVDYRSTRPASHPDTAVALETRIARTDLKMGDAVRVTVTLRNRTSQGQPMTLARIGLPGGLAFQSWQLKELVDKKMVDFYETRGREVILYLRQMAPGESRAVPLDLVATVPGDYTGPASQAYLYYTDDQRAWASPLAVHITR
jgi:hypothetical protein